MSNLSDDVRNYLARRWYLSELGRVPKASEQTTHAKNIASLGVDAAYAGIYDSDEAKAHRKSVGRKV